LAACGSSTTQSPKSQLSAAVRSLGSTSDLTLTLHLSTTPSQLTQLDHSIPGPVAALLSDATLTREVQTVNGKPLNTVVDATGQRRTPAAAGLVNSDLSLEANGTRYLELRTVKGVAYAHVDIGAFQGLTGAPLSALATQIPPGPNRQAALAVLTGHWVSVDLNQLYQGGAAPSTTANPNRAAVVSQLEGVVSRDTSVTRTSSNSGTDTLTVSANVATLGHDLLSTLATAAPQRLQAPLAQVGSRLPQKTVSAQAQVTGTTLNQVSFDLAQLARSGSPLAGQHLPLVLDVSHASHPAISAPAGAVPVNVANLGALSRQLHPGG
jgi:hypothetical protein